MASTYEPIATTTLGSAASSVTFSSISSSYTDIVLVANGALSSAYDSIELRLNGDTGTNYSRTFLSGNGSSASSGNSTNTSSLALGLMGTENSTDIFHLNNYSNSTTYKTVISRANTASNTVRAAVGTWRSTSAVNQIQVIATSGNFISGSTFTIYGIKAA